MSRSRFTAFGNHTLAYWLFLWVGFGLRLWKLGQEELWFDEAGSVFIARKPLGELLTYSLTAVSEHPPLYYVLLHYWMALTGESEFAIRFLSLLFSMLFVVMLGRLGYEIAGRRLAVAAVAIGALAPFSILHAQEARMYSVVMVLSAALLIYVQRVIRGTPHRKRTLAIIAGLSLAGVATSYFFIPVVAVAGIGLMVAKNVPLAVRRLVAVGYAVGALALVGMALLPGPRSTITALLMVNGGIESYIPKLFQAWGDISGGRLDGNPYALASFITTWGLVAWGAWQARRYPFTALHWGFWLSVWGLALVLPVLDGRYFSAAIVVIYFWLAVALYHISRVRWAAWLCLPLFLWTLVYPNWQNAQRDFGDFGTAYIDASHQTRGWFDTLVISEPDSWPLTDFYGRRALVTPTVNYVPADRTVLELTPDDIATPMETIVHSYDRIILGPINPKNRDPNSLLENYLLEHAFAVSRTFYEDSTLVAVFVSGGALNTVATEIPFGNGIVLQEAQSSDLAVDTTGKIAVRLTWRSTQSNLPRATVSMQLQDEAGRVWATQQTEPCNGWCATVNWQPDEPVTDNRAMLIPSDLPAGTYSLVLRLDSETGAIGNPYTLGSVWVVRRPSLETIAEPPVATRAGVEIRHLTLSPTTARAGDTLTWMSQWLPTASRPDGWIVQWELLRDGEVAQQWQTPPSTTAYPSADWQPEQPLRGIGTLPLDGTLAPATYQLRFQLLSLDNQPLDTAVEVAAVTIVDRPRNFELPTSGQAVNIEWQQGAVLRQLEMPASVTPAEGLPITLVWQAGGALDRSYKIFIQMRDATGTIVAQRDIYPADGGALTNTWAAGEVITDHVVLDLGEAVVPDADYQIVIGWYHQESGERLPLVAGGDESPLGTVRVVSP